MDLTSGLTTQYVPFVAVDATDLKTRKTGLSGFTVYRSRNGGSLTAYTTPTIVELSSSNAPGVYALLCDEDTTITSGANEESYFLQIAHASMAPVSLNCVLKRPIVTAGQTLTVASGRANADVTHIATAAVNTASAQLGVNVVSMANNSVTAAAIATNAIDADALATDAVIEIQSGLATAANLATVAGYLDTEIAAILQDTGTDIPAQIAGLSIPSAAAIADAVHDETVDGATTFRESTRLQNSALLGKASGLGTATATFRDLADTKDRITATVDADGNRTDVTRDAS